MKKIRAIGTGVLLALWLGLTLFAWCSPAKESSDAERRPLAQMPGITVENLLSGKFIADFEEYAVDQFPLRDRFRSLKAQVHYNLFAQQDNNGIYLVDGYAAKLDYPVNQPALNHALDRLSYVYETYLKDTDSKVYAAVIPDKGYYLAEANGYPAMDYTLLFDTVQSKLAFAQYIDLTDCLSYKDYYFTDTHWRQECILPVAQKISQALGVTAPKAEDFIQITADRPFYGVYYGQAALAMEPETLSYLESDALKNARVYNYATDAYRPVYDTELLSGKDPYDVFLSGSQSLLRLENPSAATDRVLIVFRDSFGSSLVPLLAQDYKSITLVDIRYLDSRQLQKYLEFTGQDVLFLYSTLVLNAGTTLK